MIYLIYSQEPEMARRFGLKLVRKLYPNRGEGNYVSFNMAMTSIAELVDECTALSLMSEKKAIFAENCTFLAKGGKANRASKDKDFLAFAEYCEHPNPDVDLFLVVYAKEIDEKNKAVQEIAKNGQTKEIPVPKDEDWEKEAIRIMEAKGHKISETAAKELVKRVGGDYGRFLNELAKLDAYAEEEIIALPDIEKLVSPRLEEDSFVLSNALMNGDIERAILVYEDLKSHSNDEIRLINMLSKQFAFLEQVGYLYRLGNNKFEIAKSLGASPYRVDICIRNISRMKPSTIVKILERLYRCEKSILSGSVDAEFAFTRFLAETIIA